MLFQAWELFSHHVSVWFLVWEPFWLHVLEIDIANVWSLSLLVVKSVGTVLVFFLVVVCSCLGGGGLFERHRPLWFPVVPVVPCVAPILAPPPPCALLYGNW